jgi:hypothetical protein
VNKNVLYAGGLVFNMVDELGEVVAGRLGVLLGADFKSQSVNQLVSQTGRLFKQEDVSARDLMWMYEYLLLHRDSVGTRVLVARQLNDSFGDTATRSKAESVVRWMSEGNPMYEEVTSDRVLKRLRKPLQEIAVGQKVWADARMRNVSDSMMDAKPLEEEVRRQITFRLGQGRSKSKQ